MNWAIGPSSSLVPALIISGCLGDLFPIPGNAKLSTGPGTMYVHSKHRCVAAKQEGSGLSLFSAMDSPDALRQAAVLSLILRPPSAIRR